MTAQAYDKLIYKGEDHRLAAEPLEVYFRLEGLDSPFAMISTALYRGYIGTWAVVGDRLFLNSLKVPAVGFDEATNEIVGFSTDVPLSTVFPTADGPVFAEWFTGELRCPQGELKEYCHSGFASIYEADLLLAVTAGVISGATVRRNTRGRPHPDPTSFADAACGSCGYTKRLSIPSKFWDRLWLPIGPVWCSSCKDVTLANHDEQPLCCLECGSSDLQQPSEMRGRGGWKMAWRLLRHELKHGQGSTTWQFGGHQVVIGRPEYQCPRCDQHALWFEQVIVSDPL